MNADGGHEIPYVNRLVVWSTAILTNQAVLPFHIIIKIVEGAYR